MIYKTGILITALALAILIVVPVHASMARPVPMPDPPRENRQEPLFFFENLSKVVSTGNNNSAFFNIPSTITRFDVVEIDEKSVRSLHQQILAGSKIPVRITGAPNQLWVDKNPLVPDPEDGILWYCGNLEKIPELGNKEYNLMLSFYNNTLTGQISERNGPLFYIKPITNSPAGTRLYYVYSTADEKAPGARMDNDVWVVLPSGESKNRNDLSPEECAWLMNQQRIMKNLEPADLSVTGPGKPPVTKAPLWTGTVPVAAGVVAAGMRINKSRAAGISERAGFAYTVYASPEAYHDDSVIRRDG